ncbi:MAG TPA: carboxypeptidase regulatory-like domain-containing protein, partial [Candidatus Thermoplasmatota archaeon]|nr:carboxypeptidase regulatory-like domain-containing protein [Candidatus Thermoplasmatota archaeon]
TVDLVMEKVPADSVKVSGVVRDAKSGKPIAYAQVNLENQQWGHYNYTMTDKEGAYEFWTKPGYTLVTASAYRYYYVPCEYATEPQTSDDPSGSDEPNSSGASRPMPACDGGGNERDQEYFPRVVTLNQSADEPAALDFKLEPRPAPSATFKGYVVNASSQKAVAEATVTFFNERTNDYGSAITDAEGSYTIKVHGGYYTVRVYAAGYFDGVVNAEIGDKDEQRLDIFLTPGERKYGGGCCYAVSADGGAPYKGSSGATSARASAGPQPAGAPPSAMGAPSSEDADMASDSQDGQQSYLGTGGGLGPYKPASNDGGASPASGLLTLLLVAAFVAFALRRRQG